MKNSAKSLGVNLFLQFELREKILRFSRSFDFLGSTAVCSPNISYLFFNRTKNLNCNLSNLCHKNLKEINVSFGLQKFSDVF